MTDPIDGLLGGLLLAAGDTRELELPSGMGGGYVWSVESMDPDPDGHVPVAIVSIRVQPPAPAPPPPAPRSSSSATEYLVVSALQPGRTRWRLVQSRRFGSDAPVHDSVLEITVRA